jgi:hypothetical protein
MTRGSTRSSYEPADRRQRVKETKVDLTDLHRFSAVSRLARAERVAFAGRCAGVAVRLLDSMSLPVRLKEMAALENVVRLVEEAVAEDADLCELRNRMFELRHLAFAKPAQCRFRSDSIICHVVHAVYAAGHTAITGSSVDAEDALKSAFAAVRAAESKAAEDSLWQEFRRIQRAPTVAAFPSMSAASYHAIE